MLEIRSEQPDCPYGGTIISFLGQEFGGVLETPAQLLDALTGQFVSTSQNRQGPSPKPEGLVSIRKTISFWVDQQKPIAVLVPWGSKKPTNEDGIDVAELFALRQLMALNDRVRRVYPPGLVINIGIEDLGGQFLWQDAESQLSSLRYVTEFQMLVHTLEAPFIIAKAESDLVTKVLFEDTAMLMASEIEPLIRLKVKGGMLGDIQRAEVRLEQTGWEGIIPLEQIQFYLNSYRKYYPNQTMDQHIDLISRYLGQSWARYKVGAKLAYPTWGKNFIQINFPQPVPGIPASLGDRRLYCRTLPMRFSRTHLPPWRAKGWLHIDGKEQVTPKVSPFSMLPVLDKFFVTMSNGRDAVRIEASYHLEGMADEDIMQGIYIGAKV